MPGHESLESLSKAGEWRDWAPALGFAAVPVGFRVRDDERLGEEFGVMPEF